MGVLDRGRDADGAGPVVVHVRQHVRKFLVLLRAHLDLVEDDVEAHRFTVPWRAFCGTRKKSYRSGFVTTLSTTVPGSGLT